MISLDRRGERLGFGSMKHEGPLGVEAPVETAAAIRLACEHFDVGPSDQLRIEALPGEYDANFKLTTRDRGSFVLKVMHPGRERSLVDLQCEALRHLANAAPGLRLPRVQPSRDGGLMVHGERIVWMLSFIEGAPLGEARPRTREMFVSLGRFLGELDKGLAGFTHEASRRDFKWDLSRAGWIRDSLAHLETPARKALVEHVLSLFDSRVAPRLKTLRRAVIHSDANDFNVIVAPGRPGSCEVSSVIDFGDMHHGLVAAEPAIGAAYALLGEKDPLAAAGEVVRGYHAAYPLEDEELEALFALILARLAVSVVNSAAMKALRPGDAYVTISEAPAWLALERLLKIAPDVATAALRRACDLPAVRRAPAVISWIEAHGPAMASVLDVDLRTAPSLVLDLSVSSPMLGADPRATETPALAETLRLELKNAGASVGVGRYDEARLLYVSPLFGPGEAPTDERRTIHLGVDLFIEPGAPVRAPLRGVVHILANNDAPQDYGPLVVLRHETDAGDRFFTLYGHLTLDTLDRLREGQEVVAGEEIARVGSPPSNGDWVPHLHFQIILDLLALGRDYPGVCRASERDLWTSLSPDPNLILGIPEGRFGEKKATATETLAHRRRLLGGNLSLSYRRPLKIVRGFGAYLYDETGRAFLDMYNNVPLVGHTHPRVVKAVRDQIGLLNTNTRYLHDHVVRYAERLTALMPQSLRVCYFVNSGSEANDLALRMARAHTRRRDVIVLENAYHGHTEALIDVSPYKFAGPGGSGAREFVHIAPMPDDYRGPYRRDDPSAGLKYGREVGSLIARLRGDGRAPAAFIAETLPSVGGQIVPPSGYLAEAYRHVREAGGACIADEVQVGFGRLGTHFWGFEMQGVVPDIVVLGKPIGNGFPLAAVIANEEIAASFNNGMEFFATFGGNPVACAAGLAVLDVLRDEQLQSNARGVGAQLFEGLRRLMEKHTLVGDVRGSGLFLGVELVRDRKTLEPATAETSYVVNRLRDLGVLTGADGPHENVIKLRPPLMLTPADGDLFLRAFDEVLSEDGAKAMKTARASVDPQPSPAAQLSS
jgi:4-aminobutyrate aminotransferase-like enzyme/Ser/Thr protein kinase RdoA (MazF antagonist)